MAVPTGWPERVDREAGKPKVPTQLAATSSLANRVGSGGEEGPTTGHKVLKFDRRGGPSSALDF